MSPIDLTENEITVSNPNQMSGLRLIAMISILVASPGLLCGQDTEERLLPLSLFHSFTGSDLCGVVFSSGEEDLKFHAFLVNIPQWVQESSGQKIESKADGSVLCFIYLPSSLEFFSRQHGIDLEKLESAEGQTLIDCGLFSDQLDPIDPQLLRRMEAYFARWYEKDLWTVHPRPAPQPPKWLNRPLNRKFYYEVPE